MNSRGEFTSRFRTRPSNTTTEAEAVALATAFVKQFGSDLRPALEEKAGRQINVPSLEPLQRVYFVETPYEEISESYDPYLRALLGPAYIVMFADESGPVVGVTVSVYTTDHQVIDGRLVFPRTGRIRGNQFRVTGFPSLDRFLASPEATVAHVSGQTGARVTTTPLYVWRGRPFRTNVGAWRLELDRAISVRTSQGVRKTTVLFVQIDGTFAVPIAQVGSPLKMEAASGDPLSISRRSDVGSTQIPVTLLTTGEL